MITIDADALAAIVRDAAAEGARRALRELQATAPPAAASSPWCERRELAARLRVSVATIDRQVAAGRLRSRRVGRRVLVAELEQQHGEAEQALADLRR